MAMRAADRGQMTVEFAVALPVMIVIAVIAVNALSFFADCAAFDNLFRDAVRVQATAPAYGQDAEQGRGAVESQLAAAFPRRNEAVAVERASAVEGHDRFTATLSYRPTLFGLGMRTSVLGVPIPPLSHRTSMVVDCYKPGVIV